MHTQNYYDNSKREEGRFDPIADWYWNILPYL